MKKHTSAGSFQPAPDGATPSHHPHAKYATFSRHQLVAMLERARDNNGVLRLLVAAYTGLGPRDLAHLSWSGITALTAAGSRNGGKPVH